MTTKTCSIKLLNKTYDIKCPEHEEDNLKKAAHKINEQLQANKAKFNHLGEFQNLLLASLHISHELVAFQEQHHQQQAHVTEFIRSLESKVNEVVHHHKPATAAEHTEDT
ncbi:MAG TPA: cell division protein ZapA [Legionellales bacterium]|nr:cell division protein ZapA [Legionellales bacterium]|tara:strand:+ start:2568 stop:2897 length:330 start_codon:yes stop_codon:yes gene_type:complete